MNYVLKELFKGVVSPILHDKANEYVALLSSVNEASISLNEYDQGYQKVNKLIYKLDPDKYIKYKTAATSNDSYELEDDISYFIRKRNILMKVSTYVECKESGYRQKSISIVFYGKRKHEIRYKFLQQVLKMTDKDKIKVNFLSKSDRLSNDVVVHTFDNMVLKDSVKDHIVSGLNGWRHSKEWYRKHQMTYKIGVLLYGKPGTGKSTLVKSISNMFNNAPILTINGADVLESLDEITDFRKVYNDTIIVLIEDFDMFFKDREENNKTDMNQNALFQLLDGVYSTDNTIYIATTNHKNKIDDALIRFGRFDIQEELSYFDKEDAIRAVELFGYDKSVLDRFGIEEYPVQPSYLQSKILEYRSSTYFK